VAANREVAKLAQEMRKVLRLLPYASDPKLDVEFDPEWLVVLRGNTEAIAEHFEES
jgi:hypothetical protein